VPDSRSSGTGCLTYRAGRPGYLVWCEDWKGDTQRFTFSTVKRGAGVLTCGLREWFKERITIDSVEDYERLIRKVAGKKRQPEWVGYARQAIKELKGEPQTEGGGRKGISPISGVPGLPRR